MTAKARTIAIVVAIILIAFGIYLSASLHVADLIIKLSDLVEKLTRQAETLKGI